MPRLVITGLLLAAFVAAPAAAQSGDVEVPPGYKFCGWKDYADGGWTYEDPGAGAFIRLFARKMSCRTARQKYKKVRYGTKPPYSPRLKNYRCVRLEQGYEYEDARCSRRGHPRLAIRWQAGA